MRARVPPMNSFGDRLMQSYSSVYDSKRVGDAGQVPCYRGVRLSDVEAAKVYKIDAEMIDNFGCSVAEAMIRDAHGWPIVKAGAERDFEYQ